MSINSLADLDLIPGKSTTKAEACNVAAAVVMKKALGFKNRSKSIEKK